MKKTIIRTFFSIIIASVIINGGIQQLNAEEQTYLVEERNAMEGTASVNITIIYQAITALGTLVALMALVYRIKKDRDFDLNKQAANISCWIIEEREGENGIELDAKVCVSNTSGQPIYDVIISRDVVDDQYSDMMTGYEWCRYCQCIPSGLFAILVPSSGAGMSKMFNASISFRDVNGQNWHRDARGEIKRIKENPIDYRELSRPITSTELLGLNKNEDE